MKKQQCWQNAFCASPPSVHLHSKAMQYESEVSASDEEV